MRKIIVVFLSIVFGNFINTLFDIKYLDTEYPFQWFGLKFFQLVFDGFGFYYLCISLPLIIVFELKFHKDNLAVYLFFTFLIVFFLGGLKLMKVNSSESLQSVARIATFSLIFALSYYFFSSKNNLQ